MRDIYYERVNDARGAGNNGRPRITTASGETVVGNIQPAPACYATPTAEGGVAEFWPIEVRPVLAQPHQFTYARDVLTDDVPNRVVLVDTEWVPLTPEAAAQQVRDALDSRWVQAVRGGIPVTVNSTSAVLRYTERDEARWGRWNPGVTPPANGLAVALQEPLNGKDWFRVKGVPKLTAAKDAILAHTDAADTTWEKGQDDVDAILAGPGTDEEKTAALAAYDVEAIIPKWPSNELPPSP